MIINIVFLNVALTLLSSTLKYEITVVSVRHHMRLKTGLNWIWIYASYTVNTNLRKEHWVHKSEILWAKSFSADSKCCHINFWDCLVSKAHFQISTLYKLSFLFSHWWKWYRKMFETVFPAARSSYHFHIKQGVTDILSSSPFSDVVRRCVHISTFLAVCVSLDLFNRKTVGSTSSLPVIQL